MYFVRIYRSQGSIAEQTSREWPKHPLKLKSFENLGQLFLRILRSDTVCAIERGFFDQPPVAAEKQPSLLSGNFLQLPVPIVAPVCRVETGHPQMGGKLAEMDIENEPGYPQRCFPDPLVPTDVEGLEHRVDAHTVPIADGDVQ